MMTLAEYEAIQPQLVESFTKAILAAEEKHPGSLKQWFKALSEGPSSEERNGCER